MLAATGLRLRQHRQFSTPAPLIENNFLEELNKNEGNCHQCWIKFSKNVYLEKTRAVVQQM
jgi:hypothetical protein